MGEDVLRFWFQHEVIPFESSLIGYIRRNSPSEADTHDLLHDIYEKALVGAARALPDNTGAFLFTIARNHMINLSRRAKLVSFSLIADEDKIQSRDELTPERHLTGKETLRRVEEGLRRLPPRCREIVRLRKFEGLSTAEVAARLGIGVEAVQQQTRFGIRALADFVLGGSGTIVRTRQPRRSARGRAQ